MTFDIAIINPPYAKTLHLDIMKKALQVADTVVCLHPSSYISDPSAEYGGPYKKYRQYFIPFIKSAEIISNYEANHTFGICMKELDLTIDTLCKNNDEAFNCDSVSTEKLGLFHLIMSKRKDPVVSLMQDNVYWIPYNHIDYTHNRERNQHNYPVLLRKYGIFHNGRNEKGQTLIEAKAANPVSTNGEPKYWKGICFKTYKEAVNFREYCMLPCFAYFLLSTFTLSRLPFTDDYIHEWTDDSFCRYFGISADKQAYIEQVMKEYKIR